MFWFYLYWLNYLLILIWLAESFSELAFAGWIIFWSCLYQMDHLLILALPAGPSYDLDFIGWIIFWSCLHWQKLHLCNVCGSFFTSEMHYSCLAWSDNYCLCLKRKHYKAFHKGRSCHKQFTSVVLFKWNEIFMLLIDNIRNTAELFAKWFFDFIFTDWINFWFCFTGWIIFSSLFH